MSVIRVVAPQADLVRPALADALAGGDPILVSSDPTVIAAAQLDRPTEAAVLLATSGSTGRPKIVELSAAALVASAGATANALGGPGQWWLCLPVHYIAGLQVLVRSIISGTESVDDPGRLSHGRRYTAVVPTQLRRALDTDALRGFDAVLVGGAATPPALLRAARERGINVVTTYGMTETCGGCVYDGVPLPAVTVATDANGRISLGGPTLALGYRGDPNASAVAFAGGRFHTSDAGTIDAEGRLAVHGRLDDVINTGGVKVHPLAVEAVLAAQHGVTDCAVAGMPDPDWGQAIHAWIVGEASDDALRQAVRAALGPVAVPKRLHRVEAIPLNSSGKADRRALTTEVAGAAGG